MPLPSARASLGQTLGAEHHQGNGPEEQQVDWTLDSHDRLRAIRRLSAHRRSGSYSLARGAGVLVPNRAVPTRRRPRASRSGRPRLTILAAIGLQLALPARLAAGPLWLVPAFEAALFSACSWPPHASSSTSTRAAAVWRLD